MNNMIAMILMIFISLLFIIFGIKDLSIPFRFREEVTGIYYDCISKGKKHYPRYQVNGVLMMSHFDVSPLDLPKYQGERTLYLRGDALCLNPASYFIHGLVALAVGIMLLLMAIKIF